MREKYQKTKKLSDSWKLAMECTKFLAENSASWEKRSREDTARIREEEKVERLEMIRKKADIPEGLPDKGGDTRSEAEN